ncbi:hypothetical protein B5X24_HaOG212091 [Helicoverpa armigera]|uniref:Uncharacterized protein n=1 Tax=Helicoverpa armigera TaxID=29058 RepID=A0A2W1BDZ0_HELAM|nr:hypothetical protein B5X24_HaOG212091 [Helicoverpa armigera]
MIPEPDNVLHKGQVLPKPTKMAAHEFHKAIQKVLEGRANFSETMTEDEIKRLLIEFAYRGCDIRYKVPAE